jgi:hypothetical protein
MVRCTCIVFGKHGDFQIKGMVSVYEMPPTPQFTYHMWILPTFLLTDSRPVFFFNRILAIIMFMQRPLWREDGSVVYNCCWPSPAQAFLGPSPAGLMTIFYCPRFETPWTWRARSPYLYRPGTGCSSYTSRHWVPLSSPPTTRRATVEVFDTASTRVLLREKCWIRHTHIHTHTHKHTHIYIYIYLEHNPFQETVRLSSSNDRTLITNWVKIGQMALKI